MPLMSPKVPLNADLTPTGVGVGLRSQHYSTIIENRPPISWFEAITENYIGIKGGSAGKPLRMLEAIRSHYPVVLHGVSLSIGSSDRLNFEYLKQVRELAHSIQPAWVSDHLCWTGVDGENLHDLLPLPYTEKVIRYLVPRIQRVQDFLGRQILLENVSSYMTFTESEMTEWEFLSEVSNQADCNILLDVNNIYVSAINHRFNPELYILGVPVSRVRQFHLAGHSKRGKYLIDTHDHAIIDPVWKLYETALLRFGPIPTLIERDDNIPELPELMAEALHAKHIMENTCGEIKPSAKIAPTSATLASVDHH